ncbi:MAG: hypothetical protein LBW85_06065 [Deltaproteobacteria bacterium]|jgi:hypothetical protein|nr:hypothetical protein [Deltaproteobacteria bacterium]
MFKGIQSRADPRYRGDVFCRWDFAISLVQRLVELAFLAGALFFLADACWRLGQAIFAGSAGEILGAFLLVTAFGIVRAPAGLARICLERDFGLDPRPLRARAGERFLDFLFFLPVGALGTLALHAALPVMGALAWGLCCLTLFWLALALWLMKPRLTALADRRLRKPAPGEIPPDTGRRLELISTGSAKITVDDILISTAFRPGLAAPFPMAGKIIVPEKALAAFPPKALEARIAAAALERLVSASRNLTVLRFFSMALAAPGSLILLNSVGLFFGYPLAATPGLAGLIWAGGWGAFWFSELAALFVERAVSARLLATVAAITMDARSLFESIELMARWNLDPARQTPLLDFFRPRQNPISQFEAIKAAITEMVAAASSRREKAGSAPPSSGNGKAPAGKDNGLGGAAAAPADGENSADGSAAGKSQAGKAAEASEAKEGTDTGAAGSGGSGRKN